MSDAPKSESRSDVGPWRMVVGNAEVTLYSDDFTHDVAITISGDFADNARRIAYATDIQRRLSAPISEQQHNEPVAWQWRLKGQGQWGPWKAIKCEDYAAQYFRTAQLQRGRLDAEAYEVRPLYAAPLSAERKEP